MTIANWIGIGVGAVILIVGIAVYLRCRRKLRNLDGFDGVENDLEYADNSRAGKGKKQD